MRKLFACFLVLIFVFTTGCGSSSAPKAQKKGMQELTIGLMPDTDSLPFIIAQEKGYFAEEGITVHLQQFKSAMDRDSAMQSGNLDGAVSDMLAAAFAKDGGFDVKITSATDGSYKLIAAPEERAANAAELQGRDVAVSRNTIIEYVTDQILAEQKLPEDSINKVVIPQIPTRLEMLQNGKLAAATLPEPMASIAMHNGCRFITGSDQLGINPGVMLFTAKAADGKKAEIQAMYRAYNKAAAYLNSADRSEYIDLAVSKGGFPPEAKEALELPQYHEAALPKVQDVTECMRWMVQKGLIHTQYTEKDLIVDLFKR